MADQNATNFESISAKYPVSCTTQLSVVINDPKVEVVVIATPPSTHYEIAKNFLLAGKHILVEKPFTTSSREASELLQIAAQRNLVVMVDFTALFCQRIQQAKSITSLPQFGTPSSLTSTRLNLGIVREDVNVVWDLAAHDLAMFSYWLGSRPLHVSAIGSTCGANKQVDTAYITLHYPGNAKASIEVSWTATNKVRQHTISADNISLMVDALKDHGDQTAVRVWDTVGNNVELEQSQDLPFIHPCSAAYTEPLQNLCMHMADCVNNGEQCVSPGQLGLDIVHIMEAIDKSMQLKGSAIRVQY